MPGKKKDEVVVKPKFGRPKNTLKMGIVGLPNIGKSTTFNCLTKLHVPSENFPFCTIDKNEAVCTLEDKRFDFLVDIFKPKSKVKAVINITDIAGLVRGASEGNGLGNEFLAHINEVDGLMQMVRCFDDEEITHFEGNVDPVRDLDIIKEELILKDLQRVLNAIDALEKKTRAKKDADSLKELAALNKAKELLENKTKIIDHMDWTADDIINLNKYLLLTSKPSMYLCNVDPESYFKKGNKYLVKVKQWIDANGGGIMIPFSASYEKGLMADEVEQKAPSCLNKIIKACYTTLELEHYFTCGADEVRQWTIRKGLKAPQAAGVIHTDFERGFIMAEVYNFLDIKEHKTEQAVKAKGLYRQQGKEYEVKDGDIIFFKFNVTNQKKK